MHLRGSSTRGSFLTFVRAQRVPICGRIVGGSSIIACSGIHCHKCICVGPSGVGMVHPKISRRKLKISGMCCSGVVRVYICRNEGDLCTGSVAGRVFGKIIPSSFLR